MSFPPITKRQLEILTVMRDRADDEFGELVYERGRGYVGFTTVAARTVFALLRLCAISACQCGTGIERYRINETGRHLLGQDSN